MFPRLVASAFATGVACAGVVVGYGAALGGRACDCERVDARARDAAYDREAKTFDDAVRSSEYWSGIENMRASLAYGARGDVLEVACGTGRNFSYYDPKKVRTLLAMDACDGMVEEARAKLRTRDGGTTVREAMVTRGDAREAADARRRDDGARGDGDARRLAQDEKCEDGKRGYRGGYVWVVQLRGRGGGVARDEARR